MTEPKRFSLIKPTLDTPFHIDFSWWKQSDNNWRVFLHDYLCPDHYEKFKDVNDDVEIDWIDPDTAEITRVDGLQHILISHCAKEPGFVTANTSMVDSVFRILLANGNVPLTPNELSLQLNRQPATILQTISGIKVYKGIRPCNC